MSGHVQNIEPKSQVWKLAALAVADGLDGHGDAGIDRADHPARGRVGQKLGDAADMIGMMVGE